ncbi:MAG: 30S ribosome-binding factor RbfA [Bacteroidales bacterium]|nr:30S ribosome-binding factor RbfA [Bacteroidales bacterium]
MSVRMEKISRLLQKETSTILQSQSGQLFPGVMVTVTKARVTSDLKEAKIYVSVFPPKESEKVRNALSGNLFRIKKILGDNVRNQLRAIPEIRFYIDDSLDYIDNIDNLLKK